ncbi:MAG TPA: HAD-IA family hydrolase [Solirubrobacteraceae bacterium]|nr:HAD-IA family hydrolase [Solirubrobacteraceae bacterium]
MPDRRGLIVDWGGVLTTDVFASFRAFCGAEGLPPDTVRDLFREDRRARDLLAGLETGELDHEAFQTRFAALLGVAPQGIVERLFGGIAPDEAMIGAVRAARAAGLRTGLLSNSWRAEDYDRALLEELFDAWVISGEVGMRKPDPAIYALAAERVGLPAEALVYVDDLPGNLKPARELGMATVVHRDAAETVPELEALLGVALRG